MPADKSEITYEQYLEAQLLIATVKADRWWKRNQLPGQPVERPSAAEIGSFSALKAAKYLGIGKSKFYELIRAGDLPAGFGVGGRPKWLKADLDKYLAKQKRKAT
jgi:excisionase family DNA binding protein